MGVVGGVIGEEGGGDQVELGFESGEGEVGSGMELLSVEEDEEVEGAGSREREDAAEQSVVQGDYAARGLRFKGGECGHGGVGLPRLCQERDEADDNEEEAI